MVGLPIFAFADDIIRAVHRVTHGEQVNCILRQQPTRPRHCTAWSALRQALSAAYGVHAEGSQRLQLKPVLPSVATIRLPNA